MSPQRKAQLRSLEKARAAKRHRDRIRRKMKERLEGFADKVGMGPEDALDLAVTLAEKNPAVRKLIKARKAFQSAHKRLGLKEA